MIQKILIKTPENTNNLNSPQDTLSQKIKYLKNELGKIMEDLVLNPHTEEDLIALETRKKVLEDELLKIDDKYNVVGESSHAEETVDPFEHDVIANKVAGQEKRVVNLGDR